MRFARLDSGNSSEFKIDRSLIKFASAGISTWRITYSERIRTISMSQPVASPNTKQPGQMGAWAPYYDLVMKVLTLGREQALRQMEVALSSAKDGDTVLEVGCGTGTLTLAVAKRVGAGGEVHGVDIAPEMVRVASRKNARAGGPAAFQVGQIDQLPFPDAMFDVVICSFMIFHMPEEVRRRGIHEVFRVLRAGGTFLVADMAQADLDALGRSMSEVGFVETDGGVRKVARLAPSVRYLRATARKDQATDRTA
jgi:ubiquinone/menaquinone biosynthesis C-methylase UbiE